MPKNQSTKITKSEFRDALAEIMNTAPPSLKEQINPLNSVRSVCGIVSGWLDEEFRQRVIRPNNKGEKSFCVLERTFFSLTGNIGWKSLQHYMKEYGYKISRFKKEIEITRLT